MQTVSDAWKDLQKQSFIPGAYVELTLNVTDPDAEENTTLNMEETWGFESGPPYDDEYLYNDKNERIKGEYILIGGDKSYNILVAGGYSPGFDVYFTYLTYSYTTAIPGITIVWAPEDGEYATAFNVDVTLQNGETQSVSVTGNTETENFIKLDISPSNSTDTESECTVKVTVKGWSKRYERAKIKSFYFGAVKTYGRDEIMNYSHSNTADPIASEAPVNEISFDLLDLEGLYDVANTEGISQYMMERNRVTVKYGFDINGATEWIKGGVFFLTEWDSSQSRIYTNFKARDVFGLLSDKPADLGIQGRPYLSAVLNQVMEKANLPLLDREWVEDSEWPMGGYYARPDGWVFSSALDVSLASSEDYAAFENTYSFLEILQYCANAVGCALFTDRRGQIHIEEKSAWGYNYNDEMIINKDVCYSPLKITRSEKVSAVNVNNGSHVFDIREFTAAGVPVDKGGSTVYVENPFVPNYTSNLDLYARNVCQVLGDRNNFSAEFRADPRIDVLDILMAEKNLGEGKYALRIENITLNYNGGFKGTTSGRFISVTY